MEHLKQAIEIVTRTLSEDKKVGVSFGNYNNFGWDERSNRINLPELQIDSNRLEINTIRGIADSAALCRRLHNPEIHRKYQMQQKEQVELFNTMELCRVEAIGATEYSGIYSNLGAKKLSEMLQKNMNDSGHEYQMKIADIVGLVLAAELAGIDVMDSSVDVMKKHGAVVKSGLMPFLKDMKSALYDQEQFAKIIRKAISALSGESSATQQQEQQEEGMEGKSSSSSEEDKQKHEGESEAPGKQQSKVKDGQSRKLDVTASFTEESEVADMPEVLPDTNYPEFGRNYLLDDPYKIFTTKFDQTVAANDLCENEEELMRLRHNLDAKLKNIKEATRRHANIFLRKLLAQKTRVWEYNLEEGILDPGRLAELVANPTYTQFYRKEKESENNDTVVSLLLDNSGSMRGRPITIAAMSAEILAKTLEKCGIKTEILGFTTCTWKGGKSQQLWQEEDCPKKPGRLNDLRHIIYKAADVPWRKARVNLGVMLKEGILKENIDGEAILWAIGRLAFRPEKRKILMVISDGAPVDDSTISANSADYLDKHLRQVIGWAEKYSKVELVAIGIGHDVTRYYSHAVTIKDPSNLGSTMFTELGEMFEVSGKWQVKRR